MAGKGGARAGAGRKKGVPNKLTGEVKQMILDALNAVGGVAYLQEQAEKNPGPFLTLVGKVVPHEVAGPGGGAIPHKIQVVFGE